MVKINNPSKPLFKLGQIVGTPGAIEALQKANQSAMIFLRRHICGDWGDLGDEDKRLNDEAIAHEETADTDNDLRGRVFSAYKTRSGEKIWIISEWNRKVTTILLPSDY